MSISIVILGLVLGGILTIVTLIFAIVSLAQGKSQNAIIWAVGFVVAISILILSIVQMVKRVTEKVKNGVEWAAEHGSSHLTYNGDSDNVKFEKRERQDFLDSLKKYTNENAKVPEDFYANKKFERSADNTIVLPFVFPLSVKYNSNTYLGDFINDVNDSIYLKNISKIAFDENFAIVKTDNKNDPATLKEGHGEIEYILFDLRTREYLPFSNEQMLLQKADKIGYAGPAKMKDLSEDYKGWIDSSSDVGE